MWSLDNKTKNVLKNGFVNTNPDFSIFLLANQRLCYFQFHHSWRKRKRIFPTMVAEHGPNSQNNKGVDKVEGRIEAVWKAVTDAL